MSNFYFGAYDIVMVFLALGLKGDIDVGIKSCL